MVPNRPVVSVLEACYPIRGVVPKTWFLLVSQYRCSDSLRNRFPRTCVEPATDLNPLIRLLRLDPRPRTGLIGVCLGSRIRLRRDWFSCLEDEPIGGYGHAVARALVAHVGDGANKVESPDWADAHHRGCLEQASDIQSSPRAALQATDHCIESAGSSANRSRGRPINCLGAGSRVLVKSL